MAELRVRLRRLGVADAHRVEAVLERLVAEGLASDERFAEAFLRARRARGRGPLRIAAELRERGVDAALIDAVVDPRAGDWARLAGEVRRKRFGETIPHALEERARQARFLRYRGFTEAQIRDAFGGDDGL